jgi:hypothetical protein
MIDVCFGASFFAEQGLLCYSNPYSNLGVTPVVFHGINWTLRLSPRFYLGLIWSMISLRMT